MQGRQVPFFSKIKEVMQARIRVRTTEQARGALLCFFMV